MTIHEQAITKIHQLPEPLAQEVNDFIDFLLFRRDASARRPKRQLSEAEILAESDIADYARGLADYEDRLARGDIRW